MIRFIRIRTFSTHNAAEFEMDWGNPQTLLFDMKSLKTRIANVEKTNGDASEERAGLRALESADKEIGADR